MAETEKAERITITLSGDMLTSVEHEAQRLGVGKDVVVQLAVADRYDPRVPLCQVLDALKRS